MNVEELGHFRRGYQGKKPLSDPGSESLWFGKGGWRVCCAHTWPAALFSDPSHSRWMAHGGSFCVQAHLQLVETCPRHPCLPSSALVKVKRHIRNDQSGGRGGVEEGDDADLQPPLV